MSTADEPPIVTSGRPTLPTELIDEILRDANLSPLDLARCCLVSRQFYWPSRHSLYDTIHVHHVVEEGTARSGEGGGSRKPGAITQQFLLLETLEDSLDLRSLVTQLKFTASEHFSLSDETLASASQGFHDFVRLLPNVSRVDIDKHVWNLGQVRWDVEVFSEQWTRLTISNVWTDHELLDETSFPNLTELALYDLNAEVDVIDFRLPICVTALDIRSARKPIHSFLNSSESALRVLRFPVTPPALPDLSGFRYLRDLYIVQNVDSDLDHVFPASSTDSLAQLSSLRSLSLALATSSRRLLPFLKELPPSLERLDFPWVVPFDALSSLLRSTKLSSNLRTFGISSVQANFTQGGSSIEKLRKSCMEKGIHIEPIDFRTDLFRV